MTYPDLGYKPFDADNHYYEAEDAFTRHVPKAMQPRCVQWAEIDGRRHHIVGGKLAHAVVNPTWNPIAKPGAISEYLRGNPNKLDPSTLLAEREPLPDYYMNNDARVAKLDEHSTDGSTKTGAATIRTASSVRPISRWPMSISPVRNWNGR
jgi:hypothetical protein